MTQTLPPPTSTSDSTPFEDPILLKQSPFFSRLLLWAMLAVTTFTIGWVFLAKIDQVVVAQGELEPQGTVEEVQAAANGTVAEVLVENGATVKRGEPLIVFDTESVAAELVALKRQYELLAQETAFYRAQLGQGSLSGVDLTAVDVPADVLFLVRDRSNLVGEIALLRSQLGGSTTGLSGTQRVRLRTAQASLGAQLQVDQLAVSQLQSQLAQTQAELANAQTDLALETDKLKRYEELEDAGAVAELSTIEQRQRTNAAETQVAVLTKEQQRLQEAIDQAQATVSTTVHGSQYEVQAQIAQAQQRIEEIDARLGKLIVDNERQLAQLKSEIEQTAALLVDHELVAPVAGVVFELDAYEGLVTNRSEVLLKVVPADALVAEVFIAADDIGYVAPKMDVDVRLEAFSSSDGAKIGGTILWIGDDAVEPDELNPYHRYPAKVKLMAQVVEVKGETKPLKPGMRVSASIKERKRPVIAVFADFITDRWDSLKKMR
ncbi:MAG: HlyD family efflux transporter periplasmic adaptor subunit [Spirulina sp. SIO3F2]|nr:HlyD family efflux transporter periplasmic adaptor subunit [Spirulina sp. SIO3F2]